MTVALAESELILRGYTPETFWQMPIPERRWVASDILRNRPDGENQFAAEMMERANPNFNDFVIFAGV